MNSHASLNFASLTLRWAWAAILAAATAVLFSAGAGAQDPPKFSGFLGDYSGLQARPDPALAEHYSYVRPGVDWKTYTGVVIEPVRIFLQTGAQKTGFSPRDVEAVTEYFEEALLRELAGAYPLKEQPQPGVLHLRIAITELVPTGPRQSKVGDFNPMMLLARGLKGRSIAVNVSSIAIESELLDAATGERLAAVASRKLGSGTNTGAEASSTWAEVQTAMDFWAKRLRAFLDGARAPTAAR